MIRLALSAACLALLASLGSCASRAARDLTVDLTAQAPQLNGFGAPALQTASSSAAARELFSQGVLQAYAFNEQEAVRQFKAALAQDPRCAMCAWGVAWQLGPNINAPERDDLAEARRYIALAQQHADHATPLERRLIDATALRYGAAAPTPSEAPLAAPVCGAKGSARADPLDRLYAERLRAIADAEPGNADVVSLYVEAELIATRDDWWSHATGLPAGRIGELAPRIEAALATAPDHTGLNHYLIHVQDSGPGAARALAAADRLGALAPASPHLVHMPSHIFVRVGRYADAAAANQAGLAAQAAEQAELRRQGFNETKDWDGHNLHFLWFAALMQGQGDLALATARRIAERAAASPQSAGAYRPGLPLLTLVRLERWQAVLAETASADATGAKPTNTDTSTADLPPGLAAAIAHYARGTALWRTGNRHGAAREAEALGRSLAATRTAAQGKDEDDRETSAARIALVLANLLQAELQADGGDLPAAQALLAEAITTEDQLAGEPPVLANIARVARGELLLRHRRPVEAEAAFRDDLIEQPGNGWALRGLARALADQGRAADAVQTRAALTAAWTQADTALR